MSRKLRKAFVIPPGLSRLSHPGQVPTSTKREAAKAERMFAKPKAPTDADRLRDTSPRLTAGSVVEGLGLDKAMEEGYRKFLDEQAGAAPHETRYRQAVLQKMQDDKLEPEMRRVMADRAMSYYRFRNEAAKKSMLSLDDLQKADPRGGRYYRRVTTEKGNRYYYDEERYHKREDAHLSGADVLRKRKENTMAKDNTPGESLEETPTAELAATLQQLKDRHAKSPDAGTEGRMKAISAELSKRGKKPTAQVEKAELSPEKAKQILHDKEVRGKPLTDQQRKYMGAVASGTARKSLDPIGELGEVGDVLTKSQSVCEVVLGEGMRQIEEHPARQKRIEDAEELAEADGHEMLEEAERIELKKSKEDTMDLDQWLEKSGNLPEGEPGYSEGVEVSREEDGGKIAGVGGQGGSPQNTGNGSKADVGGAPSVPTEKLSEDDRDVEEQMAEGSPKMGKSLDHANRNVIDEDPSAGHRRHAQEMTRLRKSREQDVFIPATRVERAAPLVKSESGETFAVGRGAPGVLVADHLDRYIEDTIQGPKADSFYPHGRPTIGALGDLRKSAECPACGLQKSLALSACPHCGDGTAVQSAGVIGGGVLVKSERPGPVLRRGPRAETVVLPGGIVVVDE